MECEASTWENAGLDTMNEAQSRHFCETLFADALYGHPLIANQSHWRNFPFVSNAFWSHGKMVLPGDALHTAHYSIGSGTRLALEDVLALVSALEAHPSSLREAFSFYQAERSPKVAKLVEASMRSAL